MNGLVFYIGLGLGLALAAGVRPFLPLLLAGALASAKALGVTFGGGFHFLASAWWLLAVAAALAAAYALQMLLGLEPAADPADRSRRADPLAASLTGLAYGAGAVLFAGTLSAHHDAAWPGVLGGFAAVALAQRVVAPLVVRTRARLADRAAREAVTLYVDSVALTLAAVASLLHVLGYVTVALFAWMLTRAGARSREKHAGLRILRR
jgi:Trk-type K+ transport system membrane component